MNKKRSNRSRNNPTGRKRRRTVKIWLKLSVLNIHHSLETLFLHQLLFLRLHSLILHYRFYKKYFCCIFGGSWEMTGNEGRERRRKTCNRGPHLELNRRCWSLTIWTPIDTSQWRTVTLSTVQVCLLLVWWAGEALTGPFGVCLIWTFGLKSI